MRLLVFGGFGQLGLALGRRGAIQVGREEADVTDPDAVARAIVTHRPEAIVNAAAWTDVDGAEDHEAEAMAVNAGGAGHVAVAAAASRLPLVHISTDYVFDGEHGPYAPGDAASPLGVYGMSKVQGELAVARARGTAAILRTAWLYGHDRPSFVSAILKRATAGEALRVVDDQRGQPTPADQLARAVEAAIGSTGVWHVAGQPAVTWWGFAVAIVRAAGLDVPVQPVPSSAWPTAARRPRDSRLDTSAFEQRFGMRIDWEASLPGVVEAILGS